MSDEERMPDEAFESDEWIEADASLLAEAGPAKKAEPATGAVIAGTALVWTVLKDLLAVMSKPRRIAVAVNNYPAHALTDPKYCCIGGGVESADIHVDGGHAGFVSAQKTFADGTFGVVTYKISGTQKRLAIMWSVPENRALYKNWFKVAIIPATTATNKALFKDMYYDKGKLTTGKAAKASVGSHTWETNGYVLKGTMGETPVATLNMEIRSA